MGQLETCALFFVGVNSGGNFENFEINKYPFIFSKAALVAAIRYYRFHGQTIFDFDLGKPFDRSDYCEKISWYVDTLFVSLIQTTGETINSNAGLREGTK